ncbi:hypothetical protein R3P38DRAFT_3194250 [Favolaschia claudopus]|uniref:Uncharacterized protein n=1 Tax=Favolaschia claudopus TaxID=2862362 RepID=A0AAW0BDC6_9AGAR
MPQDFTWMLPPRLQPYEDDAAIFHKEPFRSAFAKPGAQDGLVTRNQRNSVAKELLQSLFLLQFDSLITRWLLYTLGAAIVDHMPNAALHWSR